MIRLKRPAKPKSFIKSSTKATSLVWNSWKNGKAITIKPSVYSSKAVKSRLLKAQHNKCAFCETPFIRDYGQVEHYRPKAGWKQLRQNKISKPGYFWLAYEWLNLCVSCAMCNDGGHKGNVFPLTHATHRATPRNPDISIESPLLLHPFDDDPVAHITWNRDVPTLRNNSSRGKATIEIFRLTQDERLIDARRNHYNQIEVMLSTAESKQLQANQQKIIVSVLRQALRSKAPYAAMIQTNFSTRIANL